MSLALSRVCAAGSSGQSMPCHLVLGCLPQTELLTGERQLKEDPPSFANFLLCPARPVSRSETKGEVVGTSAAFVR